MKKTLKNYNIKNLFYFLLSAFFIYKLSYAVGEAIAHLTK